MLTSLSPSGHVEATLRRKPFTDTERALNKPTIYLDTTIPSAFWFEGADVLAIGRRLLTREWWETERSGFALLVSSATEDELSAGKFPRQDECLKMVQRLRYLPINRRVRDFALELIDSRVVPDSKPGDALQMAVAASHSVDYLLTWNYAHLANPTAQEKLMEFCVRRQLRCPHLVSPETIPKARFGQSIRRKT